MRVSDFVALGAAVQMRFLASDLGGASAVEAGLDDFLVIDRGCATACPGDLNGDLAVDITDVSILLAGFGTPSGAGLEEGDTDGDGDIDLEDLSNVLANFGTSCD